MEEIKEENIKKHEFKSVKASKLIESIQKAIDECGDKEIFISMTHEDSSSYTSRIGSIDLCGVGNDKNSIKEVFIISNKRLTPDEV